MKVQTQGILWSWEDRGNGLFPVLGGGASRQEGRWPQGCTITLKTEAMVYNRDTFAAYLNQSKLVLNCEKRVRRAEKGRINAVAE